MPRELIHWAVLDIAREQLSSRAPKLARALRLFLPFQRVGAIALDAPYYLRSGRSEFVAVARYLHGNAGEDTLEPFRFLARHALELPEEERARLTALIAGMVSHVAVDACFHPFVYYFSGNYYDSNLQRKKIARAKHRILEVYLEDWCKRRHPLAGNQHIRSYVNGLAVSDSVLIGRALSEMCREASLPRDAKIAGYEDCWEQSFSWLIFSQNLFLSLPFGVLMRAARQVFPSALMELDSLFAFGRKSGEFFDTETFSYQNPLSGKPEGASIPELFDRSVAMTVLLLEPLESILFGRNEPLWPGEAGPSLSFGVVGGKNKDAWIFSSEGLPLKGLWE